MILAASLTFTIEPLRLIVFLLAAALLTAALVFKRRA